MERISAAMGYGRLVLTGATLGLALGSATWAQGTDCAAQAALVMTGVEARVAGAPVEVTRARFAEGLPDEVAGLLAQWIYDLPEAQLTPAVGDAWQAQCEAM